MQPESGLTAPPEAPELSEYAFRIGTYFNGQPAYYDPTTAPNFHWGISGMSGSGKTHTIRHLIRAYYQLGITVVILDTQGDLDEFPRVPADAVNTMEFMNGRGGCGLNPLTVHDFPGSGGTYLALEQFIELCGIFRTNFGDRQKADMRRICRELYAEFGLSDDDPETWSEPSPTLADLKKRLQDIAYEEVVTEVNINKQRLESLMDLVQQMLDTRLFSSDQLTIRGGRVNRLDLSYLHSRDQRTLYHLILERFFSVAQRRTGGEELNARVPSMVIILDEAKHAAHDQKNRMSPLNRIASEGRKFGLGMVVGVQSPDQLTKDVIDNLGALLLLPVAGTSVRKTCQQVNVDKRMLQRIRSKESGLYLIQDAGQFQPLYVFPGTP